MNVYSQAFGDNEPAADCLYPPVLDLYIFFIFLFLLYFLLFFLLIKITFDF